MPRVDLTDLKVRAGRVLHGFTRGQKTMLAVSVVAAVIGAYVFLGWAASPSWTPLYSGLPADQAASVTEELDALGVAYKLEGGDTILVSRDDVYQARIDLSAQGLPEDGNPGYDLLDDHGITTSEFTQRVDYQRALEGELVRTIESIDGVEQAEVHLVLPEHDLFSDDTVRPTASVLVHSSGDRTLSGEQVRAVVHLVASSVEGLQTTDVAVADQTGRVLAAPGEEGGGAAAGSMRADQTTAFEQDLARSLEALLVPMTGPGRARVSVTAVLDMDERNTTSETFSEPGAAPVVAETTNEETYTGAGSGVGGVLGPDAVVDTGTAGATDYSRNEANRTYAVDKVTEQVRSAPGDVRRLSVAVLVDEGTGADLTDVETLVGAAAGIEEARGDQLAVTAAAFDASTLPTPAAEATDDGDASPLVPLARVAAIVLIVLVVLFLAYRSARRSAVVRHPLAIPLGAGAVHDADEPPTTALGGAPELALGPSQEDQRQLDLQSQIGDLIDRQPDEVAQVLRGWLAERRG